MTPCQNFVINISRKGWVSTNGLVSTDGLEPIFFCMQIAIQKKKKKKFRLPPLIDVDKFFQKSPYLFVEFPVGPLKFLKSLLLLNQPGMKHQDSSNQEEELEMLSLFSYYSQSIRFQDSFISYISRMNQQTIFFACEKTSKKLINRK